MKMSRAAIQAALEAVTRERNELASRLSEVLDRESATTARYDARLDEAEAERDEARKQVRMSSFVGEGYAFVEKRALDAEARADALQREVERLAKAAAPFVSPVQNADFSRQLRQHEELVAAIAAARAALEARSEQGEE
jgi:hypothetical protein